MTYKYVKITICVYLELGRLLIKLCLTVWGKQTPFLNRRGVELIAVLIQLSIVFFYCLF